MAITTIRNLRQHPLRPTAVYIRGAGRDTSAYVRTKSEPTAALITIESIKVGVSFGLFGANPLQGRKFHRV